MPANNSQLIKLHQVCRIYTVVYVYVEQEHSHTYKVNRQKNLYTKVLFFVSKMR